MDFEKIDTVHAMREKWHCRRFEVLTGKYFRPQLTYDRALAVSSGEMYDFAGKAGRSVVA